MSRARLGFEISTRLGARSSGLRNASQALRPPDRGGAQRRVDATPPAPRAVALAIVGALEGAVIALAGQAPHDELLAARAVAGVVGLDSPPAPPPT
jgi:hypothetical protein